MRFLSRLWRGCVRALLEEGGIVYINGPNCDRFEAVVVARSMSQDRKSEGRRGAARFPRVEPKQLPGRDTAAGHELMTGGFDAA
jgi:hypothetical protein